jgi:hypothetical protein
MHMTEHIFNALHTQNFDPLSIGGWFKRMELIEVKKFNLGTKGETLYNLWKCDVNFRDPDSNPFIYFSTLLYICIPVISNDSNVI